MRTTLDDAIYNTIHNYSDGKNKGPAALGPKVNIDAGYLGNKANNNMPDHKLGLLESIPIQRETRNFSIAQAYCMELGGVFVQLQNLECVSDSALLDIWATLIEREGEFATAVRESLDDGNIDHDEIKKIRDAAQQRISTLLEMVKRLESIHQQSVKTS